MHLSYDTPLFSSFFSFNDTATTELYTLSLHDALPISAAPLLIVQALAIVPVAGPGSGLRPFVHCLDRKSTRLNSSHRCISYAVFCLKKKKNKTSRDSPDYRVCRSENNSRHR